LSNLVSIRIRHVLPRLEIADLFADGHELFQSPDLFVSLARSPEPYIADLEGATGLQFGPVLWGLPFAAIASLKPWLAPLSSLAVIFQ
jgi:hypothetical protein